MISNLLASIAGSHERIDATLYPLISRIADDFVEELAKAGANIAANRLGVVNDAVPPSDSILASALQSQTYQNQQRTKTAASEGSLEAKDIKLYYDLEWERVMGPIATGLGVDIDEKAMKMKRETKNVFGTEAHVARVAAAKKANKSFVSGHSHVPRFF